MGLLGARVYIGTCGLMPVRPAGLIRGSKPKCLADDAEQHFVQAMFDHLSLIFDDRHRRQALGNGLLQQHEALCRRVLDIYMGCVRRGVALGRGANC